MYACGLNLVGEPSLNDVVCSYVFSEAKIAVKSCPLYA